MKLSAPIYRLKREAKLLARTNNIPLHQALDQLAQREGFRSWSLLAAKMAAIAPAKRLFPQLTPGDMVLVGARPGHGKTLMGIELAIEAMKSGHRGVFFTLEDSEATVLDRFRALGAEPVTFNDRFAFDNSDAISADYIIAKLDTAPRGTLAVIDYLQLLDQKRDKPDLMSQVRALQAFARQRGLILIFISQIDRSYDPTTKPCPDLDDIRLPNPLDLGLFSKTCFLNNGEVRFRGG